MITRKAWDKDRFEPQHGACPHGAFDGCPYGCFEKGGYMAAGDSPMTHNINVRDKLMYDLAEQLKVNHEAQVTLADLLIKLDRRLNPSREFYPILQTLAAGASYTHNPGMLPVAWFVSLDPTSTSGAVAILSPNFGATWITLAPGAHIVFPAREQMLTVTNTGSGNALVTIAALGDVPFNYAPS